MDIEYLKKNKLILFESISGSKAYGLSHPKSDTDIRGIFILPKKQFYSTEYIAQISNESNDIVYYELKRFFELLSKNNPNILELLNIPDDCVIYEHNLYKNIKSHQFLSKLCKETFAGYAQSQIKKAYGLNKKILNPIAKKRKTPLDFCYVTQEHKSMPLNNWLKLKGYDQKNCGLVNINHLHQLYALFYDDSGKINYKGIIQSDQSNDISLSSIPKGEKPVTYLYYNEDGYSTYCKDYKEYWEWVEKRNDARYQNTLSHGKNYDSKNMMHTFRLLSMAEDIALHQKITVRVSNRDFLMKIRSGAFEYNELLKMANDYAHKIDQDFEKSKLPLVPDLALIDDLLYKTRKSFYEIVK